MLIYTLHVPFYFIFMSLLHIFNTFNPPFSFYVPYFILFLLHFPLFNFPHYNIEQNSPHNLNAAKF
jgi:hypothetical protein